MPRPLHSSRSLSRGAAIALLCALLCALLPGCATYRAAYEARLIGSLPNQRGVSIDQSRAFPGDVLCGRYSSYTGPGFSLATRDFVVTPREVIGNATALQRSVYCVSKPQAALLEATGLGAWDEDMRRARQLRDDMRAAEVAIHSYHMRHAMMPLTLEAMTGGDFDYGKSDTIDPWGNPYRYEPGLAGRTTPVFDLVSYGADGQPGGTGENADLRFNDLALVEHVLRVRGL